MPRWSKAKIKDALAHGAHKSCNEHINFLNKKFVDVIKKVVQWMILPASMALELEELQLLPRDIVPSKIALHPVDM